MPSFVHHCVGQPNESEEQLPKAEACAKFLIVDSFHPDDLKS